MRIQALPEKERPLEKAMLDGISSVSNAELLALIIHSGMKNRSALSLAEDVLSICEGGLFDLGCKGFGELMEIPGLGPGKAAAVLAAVELGKRLSVSRQPMRHRILDADDAASIFMERLRFERKEHFAVIQLNVKGEILAQEDASVGELSSAIVHPREVFRSAVRRSAASVIFIHNHPSGDPAPSEEDLKTTERLVDAGKILGITVLDHIIIGDGSFSSLRSMGYI